MNAAAAPVFVPPLPDAAAAWRAWSELPTAAGEQSTRAARDALCAVMQLAEQGAATTRGWLDAAGASASHLSRIARAAANRASDAPDMGALWEAEIDWVSQASQEASGAVQQAMMAVLGNQAQLAEVLLGRSRRSLQRWLELLQGHGVTQQALLDPASEAPVITGSNPWLQWVEAALHANQAFWQEAASGAEPAAVAGAAEVDGGTTTPGPRGGRRLTSRTPR